MNVDVNLPLTASLIRRIEVRDRLDDDERRFIETMFTDVRTVGPGVDIVSDGDRPRQSTLVVAGLAARYTTLKGGERQITALHLPGDFVDLHSFLLKEMDHGVVAISACRVATVPHDTLTRVTEQLPHLTRLFWLLTLLDSSLHREWIVAMGRRSAVGQMAHLLCEVHVRLQIIGAAQETEFNLPVTQADLGDILGLSTVHVNRVLQELRGEGLITWKGPTVTIHDLAGFRRLAEFDDRYLHIVREPR